MKLPGYKILKEVTKHREMTLGEVCEMLRRRYGDHRDFYDLASLYTGRLVEMSIQREGSNWDMEKTSLVAEELFTMSKGQGTFKVQGMPEFTNDVDYRKECKVFCTADADLLFEQYRQKRVERIWALAVGIVVATVSVLGTAYAEGGARSCLLIFRRFEAVTRLPETSRWCAGSGVSSRGMKRTAA